MVYCSGHPLQLKRSTRKGIFDKPPKKRNFGELFNCKPFVGNQLLPERIVKGKYKGQLKKNKVGNYVYKQQSAESNPNLEYLFAKRNGFHSHPADWFNMFFPKKRTRRVLSSAVTIDELTG